MVVDLKNQGVFKNSITRKKGLEPLTDGFGDRYSTN